ncbi:MAG: Histone-lysine N-methyltransferase set9 [Candelina mexicana]|nr:MAG: Histone-lysine N-methyltransferase set9 [Candelina mexicana]
MKFKTKQAQKERLTLSQLAGYDDLLTDALVDHVYFWTTIRKNRSKYFPSRGIREEEIADILRKTVITEKDTAGAEAQVLQLPGLSKFVSNLKTDDDRENFRRHLRKYINIYLPDCPFEVSTTNRYTITSYEAAATARREIRKGDIVKYLSGTLVSMTQAEEEDLDLTRRDFSIVMSSRKKTPSLFLGPARFANHDCGGNARLTTTGSQGMQVVAIRHIQIGEEITVSYGDDYFGESNCECLCQTCENQGRNGWERTKADRLGIADQLQQGLEEWQRAESYGFRKKRRYGYESGSVTPLVTPEVTQTSSKRRKPNNRRFEIDESPSAGGRPCPGIEKKCGMGCRGPNLSKESIALDPAPLQPDSVSVVSCQERLSHTEVFNEDKTLDHSIMNEPDDRLLHPFYKTKHAFTGLPFIGPIHGGSGDHTSLSLSPSPNESHASTQSTEATSLSEGPEMIKSASIEMLCNASRLENTASSQSNTAHSVTNAIQQVGESESELSELSDRDELDDFLMTVIRRKKIKRRRRPPPPEPELRIDREPGDYIKTPLLLSEPYSRWICCTICESDFIQPDAYFTHAACPRCERHSKLYGYVWPKTDRDGKHDTEERVTDHRTVHRFIRPEEERAMRKGRRDTSNSKSLDTSRAESEATSEIEFTPRKSARSRRDRCTL